MFEVNSRWTIDGSNRRNLARYFNHSCRPNAESDVKGHKVIIVARKKIKPGEEITYDYGKDYFDIFLKPIGCKCEKCREKRRLERAEKRAKKLRAERRAAAAGKKQAVKRGKRWGRRRGRPRSGSKSRPVTLRCRRAATASKGDGPTDGRSSFEAPSASPRSHLRMTDQDFNSNSTTRSWYWPGSAGTPACVRDCA